jgi:hypothetical protein
MESRKWYRFSPSPFPENSKNSVETEKKQQRNSEFNIYSGRNDGRLEGNSDSFTESAFIKIFIKVNSMNESVLP